MIVSRLKAIDKEDHISDLEKMLAERIPKIELPDLLIEVDGWTHFSKEIIHASGGEKRPPEFFANLYALLVSQACNLGIVRMSGISNLDLNKKGFDYQTLGRSASPDGFALNRLVNRFTFDRQTAIISTQK